ncbi:MAG TPA: hypothetical protein VK928_05930 [Longimicrobiales bacterium]|nr:hypothetical protein [Longimicrobiales bacterium]
MMAAASLLFLQATRQAERMVESTDGFMQRVGQFLDSPAPYSPFSEYLLLLFVLWLIARIQHRKKNTFETQAQDVLDQKYADGELSKKAYDKFRQDATVRPKR